jgi:rubrerythrin
MILSSKQELHKNIDLIGEDRPLEDLLQANKSNGLRENLKRLGLIGATGAFFYACGNSSNDTATAAGCTLEEAKALIATGDATTLKANSSADASLLNAALGLEQEAIGLYTAAAGLPIWSATSGGTANAPAYLAIAGAFLAHHGAHAAELITQIKKLGGTPVTAKSATQYLSANGITNTALVTLPAVLLLAAKKELEATQAYSTLIASLKLIANASIFGRIAADEAAHYAIFRAAFAFLDPTVTADPFYKAASVDKLIPGAFPENWPSKPTA